MDTSLLLSQEPKTRREAVALHTQIHAACKSIFEKGDDALAEELAEFDRLRAKGDAVKAFLERLPDSSGMKSYLDDAERFINTPVRPVPHASAPGPKFRVSDVEPAGYTVVDRRRNVIDEMGPALMGAKAWDGIQEPTYAKAFYGEYLRKGERMSAAAYKALEVGLDDQGGYLAPPQTIQRIVAREPAPTNFAGKVDVITTSADAVQMIKQNYVSNATDDPNGYIFTTGFRSTWGDERTDSSTAGVAPEVSTADLFGMIRIPVYTNLITGRLSLKQVEDSGFDVQGWVESKFNETIELLYEQMALLGSGVGQPLGLVNAALATLPTGDAIPVITTGGSGVIATDDIIEISEDLPEQYDDAAEFVFSKTATNKVIRKLKDDVKRPIFVNGLVDAGYAGRGENRRMLNGYPVIWSQFMPAIASGAIPVLFGDPRGYSRVVRIGFSIQVLREIEILKQRIVLMGRLRFGGAPVEPFRFRALKIKA